jgi:hypothetical protein
MDITLKKIKVLDNRFIFAVECFYCKSLANEFNANNEPVCPKHAEQSAQWICGDSPAQREVITLEDCTDIDAYITPHANH